MQYYDEVQEVNERRKRRILEYYEYIDARTRDQMSEVVHKLTRDRVRGCPNRILRKRPEWQHQI